MNRIFPIIVVIIAIMLAVWFVIVNSEQSSSAPIRGGLIASVSYSCDAAKTIQASFYDGTSTPATATEPPIPGGSVDLTLSDGRSMTLPQTLSADGARYANTDESFIFWSKGNGSFIMENDQQTYTNCIDVATATPVSQTYSNQVRGFSLTLPNVASTSAAQYPDAYSVDESYAYQNLGPGKEITGVKFRIPGAVATGTNLSSDSYISVEQIPGLASCSATAFLEAGAKARPVNEGGVTYSMATTSDAAAGNRYDETVYAVSGSNPCTVVRYFIHYGAIQNYPPGVVREFNERDLVASFDAIRRTLVIGQ